MIRRNLILIFAAVVFLGQTIGNEISIEEIDSSVSARRIHFSIIDSTQTFAKKSAADLLESPGEWLIITADAQSNGQGHQGRTWVSASSGNLYVTFATLYPKDKDEKLFPITISCALAVTKVLQKYGLNPGIKWVNDVLIENKKISGSLCEIIPSKFEGYDVLLMGIGVNVNMTPEEAANVPVPATSIFIETKQEIKKEAVLRALFDYLRETKDSVLNDGFSSSLEQVDQFLLYKNKSIELQVSPNTILTGEMIGIDSTGNLILKTGDQTLSIDRGRILRCIGD